MYLAKMMHGAFGVLTVLAAFAALRQDDDARARFSVGLLATTPIAIYLGWLAMVELAEVFYLVLGLVWLRVWLRESTWRPAALVGAPMGAACAVKYLSVGFVVAPVAAAMLAACAFRPSRLRSLPVAAGLTLAMFAPWLVRNAAYTGNPVFPLATPTLGAGYWESPEARRQQCERRWVAGHAPEPHPPVPEPEGWTPPEDPPDRLVLLFNNFVGSDWFGTVTLITAGVAVAIALAETRNRDAWNAALIGVVVIQVAIWMAFTRGMPKRFLVPVVAPVAFLAAGALSRLTRVKTNPFRRGAPATDVNWGRAPATAVLLVAAGINLFVGYRILLTATDGMPVVPYPGKVLASEQPPYSRAAKLPAGARVMLVGGAMPFYYPPGTVYATVFDPHPLATLADRLEAGEITPAEARQALRDRGVTHVWVNWLEVWRLSRTYGFPAALRSDFLRRLDDPTAPASAAVFERLGLIEVDRLENIAPFVSAKRAEAGAPWPGWTLYAVDPPPPDDADAPEGGKKGEGKERAGTSSPSGD